MQEEKNMNEVNLNSPRSEQDYIGELHSQLIVMYEVMKEVILVNASIEKQNKESSASPSQHHPTFSQELRDAAMEGLRDSIIRREPGEASDWIDLLIKMSS